MTWPNLHDIALLTIGMFVVGWFAGDYTGEMPVALRLKLSLAQAMGAMILCLLILWLETPSPNLSPTMAANNASAEKAPPVVPKPVRTIPIAVGKGCPEGYVSVTRHDNGETTCANNFVPTTK
jgi:hypothetical protein